MMEDASWVAAAGRRETSFLHGHIPVRSDSKSACDESNSSEGSASAASRAHLSVTELNSRPAFTKLTVE